MLISRKKNVVFMYVSLFLNQKYLSQLHFNILLFICFDFPKQLSEIIDSAIFYCSNII